MTKWGIIGALLFAAACVIGYFCNFGESMIVELAAAAFVYTAIAISAFKGADEKKLKKWQAVTIIVLASVGGVICCIGGLKQSIFAEISGAAVALMAVIFGVIFANKK